MKNIEALELLSAGERVMMKDDKTNQYYQAYSDDHIYKLTPSFPCSTRIVSILTPKQFLKTESIDFVVVD